MSQIHSHNHNTNGISLSNNNYYCAWSLYRSIILRAVAITTPRCVHFSVQDEGDHQPQRVSINGSLASKHCLAQCTATLRIVQRREVRGIHPVRTERQNTQSVYHTGTYTETTERYEYVTIAPHTHRLWLQCTSAKLFALSARRHYVNHPEFIKASLTVLRL